MMQQLINFDGIAEKEIWKDVPGYNGIYQASTLGRIKSIDRIVTTKRGIKIPFKGKIVSLCPSGEGRYFVTSISNKHCYAHRIIAITFLDNPLNKPCVNHKNGLKQDNNISNLEWCTFTENSLHALRVLAKIPKKEIDERQRGPGGLPKKPIIAIFPDGTWKKYEGINYAARLLCMSPGLICCVLKGLRPHTLEVKFIYDNC